MSDDPNDDRPVAPPEKAALGPVALRPVDGAQPAGAPVAQTGFNALKPSQTRAILLAMIVLAGPMVFALDLIGRQLILGAAEPDERELLGQLATQFAWYVIPAPAIGGIIGFLVYRRIYRRQLANRKPDDDLAVIEPRADLMALMFGTTCPQLPALLGDMSVMMGARFTPALCCTGLSMLAILAIAIFGREKQAVSM